MSDKVRATHLERRAVVYLRQSTLRQLHEHRESTARQYALRQRALELGWPPERIEIIDEDMGQSGTNADRRAGFQRMAEDVAYGRVGVIFSLEVSRLARSSADWHGLLDLCGLADVLLDDEQAVYTPRDYILQGHHERSRAVLDAAAFAGRQAVQGMAWCPPPHATGGL